LPPATPTPTRPCARRWLGPNNGDPEADTRSVALPLSARDGVRYLAHVLPLTSVARRRAGPFGLPRRCFVRKAALSKPSAPEVIGASYN